MCGTISLELCLILSNIYSHIRTWYNSSSYLLGWLFIYLFIYVLVPDSQDLYSLSSKCIKSAFLLQWIIAALFLLKILIHPLGWSLDIKENIYSSFFFNKVYFNGPYFMKFCFSPHSFSESDSVSMSQFLPL